MVEGESGIGKSALVDETLRRLRAADASLLVLRGRCYENEQVPYKAFDGCMDELTRVLKRMPTEEVRALVPSHGILLSQLFPVMGAVPAIAEGSRQGLPADPRARRLEAFGVIREMLRRLAMERPLVIAVDDLQWSDAESLRLLRALVEGPRALPLLVLMTVRPPQELLGALSEELREVREYSCAQVLALKALSAEGARAALLGGLLARLGHVRRGRVPLSVVV